MVRGPHLERAIPEPGVGGAPGALQSLFSIRVSRDVLFLGGICAALTLQNSSYTLLRRYSSGVLREEAMHARASPRWRA